MTNPAQRIGVWADFLFILQNKAARTQQPNRCEKIIPNRFSRLKLRSAFYNSWQASSTMLSL
jgi:hypothetical protein